MLSVTCQGVRSGCGKAVKNGALVGNSLWLMSNPVLSDPAPPPRLPPEFVGLSQLVGQFEKSLFTCLIVPPREADSSICNLLLNLTFCPILMLILEKQHLDIFDT